MAGYKTRYPRFRVKLGSVKEIFNYKDSTNPGSINEVKFGNLETEKIKVNNLYFAKQLDTLIIKPIFIPENTLIDTKPSVDIPAGEDKGIFETALKLNTLKMLREVLGAEHAPSSYLNMSKAQTDLVTSNWQETNPAVMYFPANGGLYSASCPSSYVKLNNLWNSFVDLGSEGGSSKGLESHINSAARIVQIDTSYPAYREIQSKFKTVDNPTLYFEFGFDEYAITSTENPDLVSMNLIWKDDIGLTIDGTADVLLANSLINIKLMSNTQHQYILAFYPNGRLSFIKTSNGAVVDYRICQNEFEFNKKTEIKIIPFPCHDGGSILIESNCLKSPWLVNNLGYIKLQKNNIPILLSGDSINVGFYNTKQWNFAFCKTKYLSVDNLTTDIANNRVSGFAELPALNANNTPTSSFTTTSTAFGDVTSAATRITYNEETIAGKGKQITPYISLYTTDKYHTPYMHKARYGYPTTINDKTGEPEWPDINTLHVSKISIDCSAESIYKFKRSGSITLKNIISYPDGDPNQTPYAPPWATNSPQEAIKIQFAWAYQNPDSSIPLDSTLTWTDFFTGFISNPRISKTSYGESECTYDLQDRWKQVEEYKVFLNRYYDGVSVLNSLYDILEYTGFKVPALNGTPTAAHDITVSSYMLRQNPILPLHPGVQTSAQFKPKVNTTVADFIKEMQNIYRMCMYFDGSGKLNVKYILEIPTATTYIFADYPMDPLDCPNNATDVQPPWNSIKEGSFNRDVNKLYNTVITIGMSNPAEATDQFSADWGIAVDQASIQDSTASNYIGYAKIMADGKIYYSTKALRDYCARALLEQVKHPTEDYTFQTVGNLLQPYQPIQIKETHLKTGVDENEKYWIVGNNFTYDSATQKCDSRMQLKFLRGLPWIAAQDLVSTL